MAKIKDSVWSIFGQSVNLYFTNFGSLFKYMAFPVFGQILGILLTLGAAFIYAQNLPKWIVKGGMFDNFSMIFLILILLILPGILILAKAFWDYLIAYGAINSMVENLLKSGKIYDFPAHNQVITRRTGSFLGLWLLLGIFGTIASFPLFWVLGGILAVYFILVFQVFAFEPDKSAIGCFQKSGTIIKGNFARTLGLLTLIGGFTYWLLPLLVNLLFDLANLTTLFIIPFDTWAQQLPISEINQSIKMYTFGFELTSLVIAKTLVNVFLSSIIIGITLPLRTICCALWYKNLNKAEIKLDKKILDRAMKSE